MSNSQKPRNPYYDYGVVRELAMFFGRDDEVRDLLDDTYRRQCVSLVGTRHIGKSSLLHFLGNTELHKHLGCELQAEKRIFVLLDFKGFLKKTRNHFFLAACEEIIAQCSRIPTLASLQISTERGDDQLSNLLKEIDKAGYHTVLLMDAFDNIVKNEQFDIAFLSSLRALAERDLVSYITASSKPLHEVCHYDLRISPFFGIFRKYHLGAFTDMGARRLIEIPAANEHLPFTNEEVEWILEYAGRHPFFLQVTCGELFKEKCKQVDTNNTGGINLKYVQEQAYKQLLHHFDHIWDDLSREQQQDIKREITRQTSGNRKIQELSESWLFRKRVREKSKIDQLDLTPKNVKDALDNMDNNEDLGQSKLADTNYVFLRHRNIQASDNKKGMIVREFLKTGFERMSPGGRRSDTAIEWRLYNILYHRYFVSRFPNEITQMRLEIGSRRQYYREQERAIQALLKELMELEEEALNNDEV